MRRTLLALTAVLVILLASPAAGQAQCPMCKANVEASMREGESGKGFGLNDGILLLLAMPYLAVGTLGFLWYRSRQKAKAQHQADGAGNPMPGA